MRQALMLPPAGGYITHSPLDQGDDPAGVGKGVFGIKLDPETSASAACWLAVFSTTIWDTESVGARDFCPGAVKAVLVAEGARSAFQLTPIPRALCATNRTSPTGKGRGQEVKDGE